jgi:alpha-beta hydrolase superfamily lysophospholipase
MRWRIGAICCLLLLLCGGCASDIADRLLRPPVFPQLARQREMEAQRIAARWGKHLHQFRYRGEGGIRLAAVSLDPRGAARGTVVLLHGLGDQKEGMLPFAEAFALAGYRAIAPDLRAHGQSGGDYCTFGYDEKWDCRALLDAVKERGYPVDHVGVIGGSLGAAVALQWAAVDPRVKTVIALAPFARMSVEADYLLRRNDPSISPQRLAHIKRLVEEQGELKIADVNPLEAVRRRAIPIYLVHGKRDEIIPVQASHRLFDAAGGPVVFQEVPDAGHLDLVSAIGEPFLKRAIQWFDAYAASAPRRPPPWVWTLPHRNFGDATSRRAQRPPARPTSSAPLAAIR